MAKAAILACGALALTGAAPAKDLPVLDPIFKFADPARCVPSPMFGQILDRLFVPARLGGRSGDLILPVGYEDVLAYYDTKPGAPRVPMIVEMVGNNGRRDVSASIRGMWHGLPLNSITVWRGPPTGATMVELGFDAAPERVAQVLSDMGFTPDPEGEAKLACRIT